MNPTKALLCAGIALLLNAGAGRGATITIGFDDLAPSDPDAYPPWTVVTNQYAGLGVVFSTGWLDETRSSEPNPIVHPSYAGRTENWGAHGVGFESYCDAAQVVRAGLSIPTNFVSVDMQPFESGDYLLGLRAYDSAGVLLAERLDNVTATGSVFGVPGIDPAELVTLSLTTALPGIAYVQFYGYHGEGGINSVDFDNFTFGTVPDSGGTLGLLLLGLAVLLLRKRSHR